MLFDHLDFYWLKVPRCYIVFICLSVCIYISLLHTCMYMYACTYVYTYMCMYIYVHVCVYIYKTKPRADINHTQVWIINPGLFTITVNGNIWILWALVSSSTTWPNTHLEVNTMHRIVQYLAHSRHQMDTICYVNISFKSDLIIPFT